MNKNGLGLQQGRRGASCRERCRSRPPARHRDWGSTPSGLGFGGCDPKMRFGLVAPSQSSLHTWVPSISHSSPKCRVLLGCSPLSYQGQHRCESRHLTEQTGGIDPAINVAFPLPPAIAGLIPAQHEKHVLTCWPGDLPAKRFKSSPGAQIRQGDSFLLGNAAHTQHQT